MLPLTPPEPSAAPAPPGDSDKLPVHLGSVMASWQIPVHSGRPRSGQGPSLHWRPHALSVATPDCGPQAPAEAQAPSRAPELPGAPAAWRVEGACSLVCGARCMWHRVSKMRLRRDGSWDSAASPCYEDCHTLVVHVIYKSPALCWRCAGARDPATDKAQPLARETEKKPNLS